MRHFFGNEQRATAAGPRHNKLRKHVAGMFIRIAGQRGQSFELANCLEPATNGRAEFPLPSLCREDQLRAPESEDIEDAGKEILTRLDGFGETRELSDRFGGLKTIALEGSLQ